MSYKIRIIDTETTGIPTELDRHAVVELGFVDLVIIDGDTARIEIGAPQGLLCNPGRPIPVEATAVHHIRDRDVAGCPDPGRAFLSIHDPSIDCFAAHKAEFDKQFYSGGGKPWICTMRTAIMTVQDAPNYQNQTLRYLFGVDDEPDFNHRYSRDMHRAPNDAYITAFVLRALIRRGVTIPQMQEYMARPILLPKVNFGKFKGKPWSVADKSYLNWLVTKSEMTGDRDIMHTAKFWLRQ